MHNFVNITAILFIITLLFTRFCSSQLEHHTRKGQTVHQRMLQAATGKLRQKTSAQQGTMENTYMTAPQCRCRVIRDCNQQLTDANIKCRVNAKCEAFLKKIGDSVKIRACLTREQADMERLEDCVEKKVGPVGCTNDEHPKNLTIPIMVMSGTQENKRPKRGAVHRKQSQSNNNNGAVSNNKQDFGHAPMELSDYLMCVDECAMSALNDESRMCTSRNSPLNCAVKLQCTLAPPDQKGQRAFEQCEKETGLLSEQRFRTSCNCLKNAGVNIQCPK